MIYYGFSKKLSDDVRSDKRHTSFLSDQRIGFLNNCTTTIAYEYAFGGCWEMAVSVHVRRSSALGSYTHAKLALLFLRLGTFSAPWFTILLR